MEVDGARAPARTGVDLGDHPIDHQHRADRRRVTQHDGFHGTYREIVRPERVVRTFVFEPMPEHEAIETLALEEHDDKTTITTTTAHKTVQARDGHLANGRMEAGMTEGYERLDALLARMQER